METTVGPLCIRKGFKKEYLGQDDQTFQACTPNVKDAGIRLQIRQQM